MKKSLIALAVLAAAGAASAQSSVTLFGIVDATVQHVSNSGGTSVTRLHNSGESSSRLGFRGTEDLGGGLSGSFWLEAGLNNDDGTGQTLSTNNQFAGVSGTALVAGGGEAGRNTRANNGTGLVFNRRSTVSLAGGFGEIRLGRDYTPQFWNLTVFDPYGTVGVGTNLLLNSNPFPTNVRASNTIGYFLPGNLGGFYGQIQAYRGENASNVANSGDGNGFGGRLGYAAGPVNVALATGRTNSVAVGKMTQSNLGASWNFGVATVMAQVARDKIDAPTNVKGRGYLLGATVPVGAGLIKASVAQYTTDVAAGTDPRARKYALGYVHNLSKRTAVYTTWARVKNNATSALSVFPGAVPGTLGGPTLGSSSSGYDLGIRHSF